MHALDWLGDLIHAISLVIPRLVQVRKTHGGVLFRRGKVIPIGPGMRWYWPIWSEIQQVSTVRQTLNLSYQCLISKDLEQLVVAAIVVYRIDNTLAALTETDNVQDTIHDVAMNALRRVVGSCTFAEIHTNKRETGSDKKQSIDAMLRHRLQVDLASYGVAVDRAFLSDIARPLIVRLMGDVLSN